MNHLLELRGLRKTFGGIAALQAFDLDLRSGECVGLIGPNGAGKSTLLNLIAGVSTPTGGSLRFLGRDVTGWPAHRRCRLGIAKTFQITRPFAHLTVLENVMTASFLRHRHPAESRSRATQLLDQLGLAPLAYRSAGELSTAYRKRLEVCRALATEPKLLLLDEVFAGLSAAEMDEALSWARELSTMGITIIITEHLLPPITALAQRVIVLDQGQKICDDSTTCALQDPRVLTAYLGTDNEVPA